MIYLSPISFVFPHVYSSISEFSFVCDRQKKNSVISLDDPSDRFFPPFIFFRNYALIHLSKSVWCNLFFYLGVLIGLELEAYFRGSFQGYSSNVLR